MPFTLMVFHLSIYNAAGLIKDPLLSYENVQQRFHDSDFKEISITCLVILLMFQQHKHVYQVVGYERPSYASVA